MISMAVIDQQYCDYSSSDPTEALILSSSATEALIFSSSASSAACSARFAASAASAAAARAVAISVLRRARRKAASGENGSGVAESVANNCVG